MYIPRRDSRFEYIWELLSHVEERQCNDCFFKSDREGYPMCGEVEAQVIEEGPVVELDDRGEHGVVCTKYRDVVLAEQEHIDQYRLF